MSAVPKYAYVVYKDGGKAIVATTLIKRYAPASVTDLAKCKEVYWRSVYNDETVEAYYPGDVVLLGVSKTDLIQRMAKKNIPVPDNVFESDEEENAVTTQKTLSQKEKGKRTAESRKRKLHEVLGEDQGSSDHELVKKKSHKEVHDHNKKLQEKVRQLQQKVEALESRNERLEARNDRLQVLLEHKLEAWLSNPPQHNPASSITSGTSADICRRVNILDNDGNILAETLVETDELIVLGNETSNASLVDSMTASVIASCSQEAPTEIHATETSCDVSMVDTMSASVVASCSQTSSHMRLSAVAEASSLPVLSEVNGQVHLGKGIFVTQEQWQWLLGRKRDSLFCKETVKVLWPLSELKNRSLTGAPCRRFAKKDNGAQGRRALTPVKLQAVANAFEAYVNHTPADQPQADRVKRMNRFIAELLNDLNK